MTEMSPDHLPSKPHSLDRPRTVGTSALPSFDRDTPQYPSDHAHAHPPSPSPDAEKQPPPAGADFPDGGPRAWSVALATSGIMFCTMGYMNSFGVYQAYYEAHQLRGSSSSAVAWIGSAQAFFLFAGAVVGGPLFDRFGAVVSVSPLPPNRGGGTSQRVCADAPGTQVIYPSATAYLLSVMLTSVSTAYWHLLLAQGLLGGLALGTTWAPAMAATAQYFHARRGAAMGLAIAGSSLGGVLFPIMLGRLLTCTGLGFGWSVRAVGFLMLGVLVPACAAVRARLPPRKGRFFLWGAFAEPRFATLVGSGFLAMMGMFVPMFFLPVYAETRGMSAALAAYLLAILNGASFFGRVVPGVLSDKLGHFNLFAAATACTGVLVLCWTRCKTNAAIIVFAALFGFFSGAIISGVSVCLASCARDPAATGTFMGMGMAVGSVAALVGPPVAGEIVGRYGGFDEVAVYCGVFLLASAVVAFVAKIVGGDRALSKA